MALHPGPVRICSGVRFYKRCKDAHRFTIADTRGSLTLTVPLEKPYGRTWASTRISLHGNWWEVMAAALESAYGRTPFFEFYADDFLPLIASPDGFTTVGDLNERFDRAVRRALGLQTEVIYDSEPLTAPLSAVEPWQPQPYWQVRAATLGFIPGLSILDLLFNLGPESLLLLSNS